MPTRGRHDMNEDVSMVGLDNLAGLMEKIKKMVHIREFAATQIISRSFNIQVHQREYHRRGLMIKRAVDFKKKGVLVPDGEGSLRINQRTNNGAYKLEYLEDIEISRT